MQKELLIRNVSNVLNWMYFRYAGSRDAYSKNDSGHFEEMRTKDKQNKENRETKMARMGKEHGRKIGLSQVCRRVRCAGGTTDSKANWSQPYLI